LVSTSHVHQGASTKKVLLRGAINGPGGFFHGKKGDLMEYVVLPPGHHGARILNLSETDILKSQKNRKKIMHVDNHDFYLHAKNQSKILCILACIKKTNIQI
jgi:hypothetical protein